MTFSCDPTTRAELDASPNKLADAAVLNAALGSNRIITCKRDSNAAAADPWATGTIFRKVACTGSLKTQAGKVVGLGRIKGTTISLPADVATGKSVMRIEGNGRWIQVSMGAVGSNADIVASVPFTATNGLSVSPSFAISGKRFKPSGTGKAVPALTANAPYTIKVWNHTNPTTPVLAGSANFDNRVDDFVFQQPDMAANIGDVGWYQSNSTIMHGDFEFGIHMHVSDKTNTIENTEPLYEVSVSMAKRGGWVGYPASEFYDIKAHFTHPDPFKVTIHNQAGTQIGVIEMYETGLPINSPQLSQSWTASAALNPLTNCGNMLVWQSARPKKNDYINKVYGSLIADAKRPRVGKKQYSVLASPPMITGGYQGNSMNGLLNIWAADRWPRVRAPWTPTVPDPNFSYGPFNNNGNHYYCAPWASGWDYSPGSFSNHDGFTGPGGPRFDRSSIPSIVALYATNPTGARPQDNISHYEQLLAYSKGFFNHPHHWVEDPKTLRLGTKDDLVNSKWVIHYNYYGDDNKGNGPKRISQVSVSSGADYTGAQLDNRGNLPWRGDAKDTLHFYCARAWSGMALRSPMFAIHAIFDTRLSWFMHGPAEYDTAFSERNQAWDWLHLALAWNMASDHGNGVTQREVEDRFAKHLECIYNTYYVPAIVQNRQEPRWAMIRNLGVDTNENAESHQTRGAFLTFYMTNVFVLMKKSGMWASMIARGGHVKTVMEWQVALLDKHCTGTLLDTYYTEAYYQYLPKSPVATTWAEYQAAKGRDGLEDLVHNPDGSVRSGDGTADRDVSQHLTLAYAIMRADIFPEYEFVRGAETKAKALAYYAAVTAANDATEWNLLYPGIAAATVPA